MTTKQPKTPRLLPFIRGKATAPCGCTYERYGHMEMDDLGTSEQARITHIRVTHCQMADMHGAEPCEWQRAMLGISFLGAGGELVNNPKAAADRLEQTCRANHEARVRLQKRLNNIAPLVEAVNSAGLRAVTVLRWHEANGHGSTDGKLAIDALIAALAAFDKAQGKE